jgi:K+-transporting ATPase ATPase C chain
MLFLSSIKYSVKFFIFFTIVLGILYPLTIYITGQLFFSNKADGSLIVKNGEVRGSYLLGQKFTSDKYFWPRPSAINYNPYPSGASNFSQTSDTLLKLYEQRKNYFIKENKLPKTVQIPSEMLFASASGVDPDISKEAAIMQTKRIIYARKFDKLQSVQLINLINSLTEPPQFGILGNEVVNVQKLNIKLDEMSK